MDSLSAGTLTSLGEASASAVAARRVNTRYAGLTDHLFSGDRLRPESVIDMDRNR
jgi:hypothetical protein